MPGSRLLTAVLLAGLGSLLAVAVAWRPASPPDSSSARSPVVDRVAPLAVLADWDRARAEAWRAGDPAALAGLYARGSATGDADRALLAAYAERGLRVAGLRMQRAAVEVVTTDDDRMVLEVTDRLVGGTAIAAGHRTPLPRDSWSTRTVVLVRGDGGWLVAAVREQDQD